VTKCIAGIAHLVERNLAKVEAVGSNPTTRSNKLIINDIKMVSKNDITGDAIQSKTLSKQGRDNWDKIFGKKEKTVESVKKEKDINKEK
jgi:hypothetical protein